MFRVTGNVVHEREDLNECNLCILSHTYTCVCVRHAHIHFVTHCYCVYSIDKLAVSHISRQHSYAHNSSASFFPFDDLPFHTLEKDIHVIF